MHGFELVQEILGIIGDVVSWRHSLFDFQIEYLSDF